MTALMTSADCILRSWQRKSDGEGTLGGSRCFGEAKTKSGKAVALPDPTGYSPWGGCRPWHGDGQPTKFQSHFYGIGF